MQVRLSTVLGLAVHEEETSQLLGAISGILIHPDTGKIEGFFVAIAGFLQSEQLFLSTIDILAWGMSVRIRSRDDLTLPEERVRLLPLLEDPRRVIGQLIRSEHGETIGRCQDIQFDTQNFQVEWLFPKHWWHWKIAIPVTEILEVRKEAIIVKDQKPLDIEPAPSAEQSLLKVPDMA